MKKLAVFDLDGTLAESKAAIDTEMAVLLTALLGVVKVALISGGDVPQFQTQILAHLPQDDRFDNLALLPANGTRSLPYANGWHKLYSEDLSEAQKQKSIAALNEAVASSGYQAERTWGEPIE